ncbi:DUF4255 domain-containing protein [Hellea sp.]|nr:DUF4255 domain-containing protein [Hellea sp.]
MANALAIAAVTATLKDLLNDGVINGDLDALGQVDVSAQPPDQLITDTPKNGLNIYPWKVTHNTAYSNQDLPAYSSKGTRLKNARLALDIHYILTATGTKDLNAPILMGFGMQQMHETPILTSKALRRTLTSPTGTVSPGILPAALIMLQGADLAEQIESVRITPAKNENDELSKIWPAFNASLRLSALYQVSLVLIQAKRNKSPSLPVKSVSLNVQPLLRPTIEKIEFQTGDRDQIGQSGSIPMSSRLLITGSGLASGSVRVKIKDKIFIPNDIEGDPNSDLVSATAISLRLPTPTSSPNPPRIGLEAGLSLVLVEHLFAPERSLEVSNPAAAIILPEIKTITHTGTVTTQNGVQIFKGQIQIELTHELGKRQDAKLHLNPIAGSASGDSFTLEALPRTAANAPLIFPAEGVPSTTYLRRLEIDGARTLLTPLTGGPYTGPPLLLNANP